MRTVFLLSPARSGGERANVLVRSKTSPLGARLRAGNATLGEVFTWLSALYFRGKLTYARKFAGDGAVLVMAPGLGLRPPELSLTVKQFRAMGRVTIEGRTFVRALRRDAEAVRDQYPDARVVLLGSIATTKYIAPLVDVFGQRLVFPETFVGRGDMSRGGLLLRCARAGEELAYVPVAGAVRHGARAPKLSALPRRVIEPRP